MLPTINVLHTLGPAGTNCAAAAEEWFRRRAQAGDVVLHATLEDAVTAMPRDAAHALMGCIAYPALHELMFGALGELRLVDCLIMPTHAMVLASRGTENPRSVTSHPAPRRLVPDGVEVRLSTSNAQAARDCAAGLTDACITTRPAAAAHGLTVIADHGSIHMGFSIHAWEPHALAARRA